MSNGSLITQAGLHLDKIVEIEEGKVLIFAKQINTGFNNNLNRNLIYTLVCIDLTIYFF